MEKGNTVDIAREGLGLASLKLTSSSDASDGLRDQEIVASALAFALEIHDSRDTEILDTLELESLVRARIETRALPESPSACASEGGPLQNFLGAVDDPHGQPANVIVERGGCSVKVASPWMHTVLGTDSFSSVRIDCGAALKSGAWAFEVQIHTPGIMQIGWVTDHTQYTFEDGVGA